MTVQKIVTVPEKVLLQKAEEIKDINEEIVQLAKDLKDTLKHAKKPEGAGIAANQIGVAKRMCIVRNFISPTKNNRDLVSEDFILLNPKIIWKSPELDTDWEGCLSVPDKYGMVARNKKIKVEALTLDGNLIQMTAKDLFARIIQHEVDHLDGILFTSKVTGKIISENELDEILGYSEDY